MVARHSIAEHEGQEGAYKAFLFGIKPSIWLSKTEDNVIISKLINKRFPRKKIVTARSEFYWFFRNKEEKDKFVANNIDTIIKSGDRDHLLIGTSLGYPPFAVQHFSKGRDLNNIFISYAGMYFASYPSTIKSDVDWLLNNRPAPKNNGLKVIVNNDILYVDEEEFESKLKNVAATYTNY